MENVKDGAEDEEKKMKKKMKGGKITRTRTKFYTGNYMVILCTRFVKR